MHLLSCENPQRVKNKYTGEVVWTACGKCNTCRNARAARWTDALERERSMHPYCMFVTLTYEDKYLPLVNVESGLGFQHFSFNDYTVLDRNNHVFVSSRIHDSICIPFRDFKLKTSSIEEKNLFFSLYHQFGGIPYASSSDIQLFNKRLNKWFFKNVSGKFKNFRYFLVSEFGTTTLRPHFHGIYYTDDQKVADRFKEGVRLCWKLGITDTKYVENSACSYVAQYVNKFADLPFFYQTRQLKPRYWYSKNPTIGVEDFTDIRRTGSLGSPSLQEVFDKGLVETCVRRKATSTDFISRPLHKSFENRLYRKCPFFKSLSHSLRVELYSISSRFKREGKCSFQNFLKEVFIYLQRIYDHPYWSNVLPRSEFSDFLYNLFYIPYTSVDDKESERGYNWLRRLYYLSRKVLRIMYDFNITISTYVDRVEKYYIKKELYLLRKFYEFQSSYKGSVEDLALMYPEYVKYTLGSFAAYFDSYGVPKDLEIMKKDAAHFAFSNKLTHFKNAYLDSFQFKKRYSSLFVSLKNYFYAQKCNEVIEAFAA